jgi:hypothetical protein
MDSQDSFKKDLAVGNLIEEVVLRRIKSKYPCAIRIVSKCSLYDIWIPEIGKSVEVKYDNKSSETKNIIVEVWMYNKPSGLLSSSADYWVFCDKDTFLWITLNKLKELVILSKERWVDLTFKGDTNSKRVYFIKRSLIEENAITTL